MKFTILTTRWLPGSRRPELDRFEVEDSADGRRTNAKVERLQAQGYSIAAVLNDQVQVRSQQRDRR